MIDKNEIFGSLPINPESCKNCKFQNGPPPFADKPNKAYCIIYSKELNMPKPDSVYHFGEKCKYFEEND